MKGACLCEKVVFRIDGELLNFYQCHCSLCRKATGAAANAATFVSQDDVRWLSGEEAITSFQKDTGYRSDFCSVCGSPVPNPIGNTGKAWLPAGLLDDTTGANISVHLHLSSSASWERDAENCSRLQGGPDSLESLNKSLQFVPGLAALHRTR